MSDNNNPIDEIEHRLDIGEAATAADADRLLAEAQEREEKANEEGAKAATNEQRLGAHVAGIEAVEDQIRIKATDSKANWELGQMSRGPRE